MFNSRRLNKYHLRGFDEQCTRRRLRATMCLDTSFCPPPRPLALLISFALLSSIADSRAFSAEY